MGRILRGQGSVEFLMTYGWAMLIILVVMVVLWQWGLFSLGESIEPGSFGFWGLVVQDGTEFILHENGTLQVSLLNTVGANVTVDSCAVKVGTTTVECNDPCNDGTIVRKDATPDCIVPPGEIRRIEVGDATWNTPSGKRFDASIAIVYKDVRTGENQYQSSGRIWGNAEP